MNIPLPQLEAIAKLSERYEYAVLMAVLRDECAKRTREALNTANPQACGAAALLQDLIDTLGNARILYDRARKTAAGGSGLSP